MKNKVLSDVLLLIAAIMFILSCVSLGHYLLYANEYRFGTEIADWKYRSSSNYVSISIFQLVASLLVIIISILKGTRTYVNVQIILIALIISSIVFL